jgi:ACS family hexuronate transporter-like MFS transporter
MWRAALGVTEAGNFPAANKPSPNGFRKRNARLPPGSTIPGQTSAPLSRRLTVPLDREAWVGSGRSSSPVRWVSRGWHILVSALRIARRETAERQTFQAEYDYIHSDVDEQEAEKTEGSKEKVSWFKLLTFRQTWAFVVGKFMTDPIWWFFLFWLPAFLNGENARKVKAFLAHFPPTRS